MKTAYFTFLIIAGLIPKFAFGDIFIPNYAVPFPPVQTQTMPQQTQSGQTGGTSLLTASNFPKTFNDVDFAERIAVKRAAYVPFQDMDAYKGLVVAGEEHYTERQLAELEIQRQQDSLSLPKAEYCDKYPTDDEYCSPDESTLADTIKIGDAPSPDTKQPFTPVGSFSGRTIGGGAVIARNDIHNGSCYPAAKSKVFKNMVMTTGQYETSLPPFEKAMITVFRKEGKCGEIKGDPCGYTCYGIGSGPNCMGHDIDVKNLTRAGAEKLYHDRMWAKYHFDRLPDVIAGDIFLASMASGPCTAIKQYRGFLGLSKNCNIDNDVVRATENYTGDIHNDWLDVRQKFLIDVAERKYQNRVLKGWMNAIQLKRENGCHVIPTDPLYR